MRVKVTRWGDVRHVMACGYLMRVRGGGGEDEVNTI